MTLIPAFSDIDSVEQVLLGALLMAPGEFGPLADQLTAEDFYIIKHGWLWDTLFELYRADTAIDTVTVADALRRSGRLAEMGGAAWLTQLINLAPPDPQIGAYVYCVQGESYRRKAQALASDVASHAHSGMDPQQLQARLEAMTDRLRRCVPGQDTGYHPGKGDSALYAQILAARAADHAPDTFSLPFAPLTDYIPSIRPGKLIVVSGLEGSGKTALMEEWAEWLAVIGFRVLYITTELTHEDHLDRRYVRHTGLHYAQVADPTPDVQARIDQVSLDLDEWQGRLDVVEYSGGGHELVIAQMKRAHQAGVQAVFIDYFWETLADEQRGTIEAAVTGYHRFAKDHGLLLVVGSQLTETAEGLRTYGTRRLPQKAAAHLRIERAKTQEVTETYQAGGSLVEVEADKASPFREIAVVKNTFGPTGSTRMFLHGARFRWLPASEIGYGGGKLAGYATERDRQEPAELDLERAYK